MISFFQPRKKNLFDAKAPRILIVSTTALGDTLWATPAFAAIKKRYPQSFLALLCQKVGQELVKNQPLIDECYSFEEPLFFSFPSLFFKLRAKKFQAICIFHSSQRLVFPLCVLLGAEKMVGFQGKNKGLDFLFSHVIERQKIHEIENRANLLKLFDIRLEKKELDYAVLQEEERDIDLFLKGKGIDAKKPIIILHPGATDSFKRWPENSYIALGQKLLQEIDCHLLISGTGKEKRLIEHISSKIKGSIALFPPLSLRNFAALLKKADLLVTNDTGPMHLSLAVKTKTLALFLPTDPATTGPYHAPHGLAIAEKIPCTPCIQRKCKHPHCWEKIKVDVVFEKAKNLLR
jgi:ADP-heptose:LPS heptosyltransferase